MGDSKEDLMSHLMRLEEESEKAGLKFNIKKKTTTKNPKIMARVVTAPMKLEDTCSLEGKL